MRHICKDYIIKPKLSEINIFVKNKIYKKKFIFFRNPVPRKISFWNLSIFYKNTFSPERSREKEFMFHMKHFDEKIRIKEAFFLFQKGSNIHVCIDISSLGLDFLQSVALWNNFHYVSKHLRNSSSVFTKISIKLKSKSHILLDKKTPSLKALISKKHFVLKRNLFIRNVFLKKRLSYVNISSSFDEIKFI